MGKARGSAKKLDPERRQDVRARIDLRVAYGTAFDVHTTAYMHDIGHGGVFIRTDNPLEIGAVVDLEFTLADLFKTIRAQAKVVWSRTEADGDMFPMGMGLTFLEIQPEDQKLLGDYVRKLARAGK